VVEIVPATLEHAADLAPRVRPADRAEIYAMSMMEPALALELSVGSSSTAYATLDDAGRVICLAGVAPRSLLSGNGTVWLIASPDVERMPMTFLRTTRAYLTRLKSEYRVLMNHVDARNEKSIAWLRWLGASIADPVPFGPLGLPFHPFELRC
jgi:hypothetical protein